MKSAISVDLDDQLIHTSSERPDENREIPPEQLSGDEASERSFSVNSLYAGARKNAKASIPQSSVIVSKSILGVGILGLPYVAKQFGVLFTILLIVVFYVQTQYATKLLLKCKNLCGRSNFSSIGLTVFETRAILIFINLIIIINNFGLCFAEMIIQGTAAFNIMGELYTQQEWYKYLYSAASAAIMAPMMVIHKIEKLKYAGAFALLSMAIFTIVIVVSFFRSIYNAELPASFTLLPNDFDILKALGAFPTLLLAYNWQFNLFPVYKGLQKPSDKNVMKASFAGMFISTLFYLIVGIFGYGIFGSEMESNFLKMAKKEKIGQVPFFLLNLSFYISTVLTTPLVFYGARNNFLQLTKPKTKRTLISAEEGDQSIEAVKERKRQLVRQEKIRFYAWSLGLWTIIVVGAMFINSLEVAFNFVGSISSNSIGCLLPSLFYFKLVRRNFKGFQLSKAESLKYRFAQVFFVYSILASVLCLASEFVNQLRK